MLPAFGEQGPKPGYLYLTPSRGKQTHRSLGAGACSGLQAAETFEAIAEERFTLRPRGRGAACSRAARLMPSSESAKRWLKVSPFCFCVCVCVLGAAVRLARRRRKHCAVGADEVAAQQHRISLSLAAPLPHLKLAQVIRNTSIFCCSCCCFLGRCASNALPCRDEPQLVLGAGFKPVGELHSQPFDSAFAASR